jgi:hypothetical protein
MNLLKLHGDPEAQAVLEFLAEHKNDTVFQSRAMVLKRVFLIDQLRPQRPEVPEAEELPVAAD